MYIVLLYNVSLEPVLWRMFVIRYDAVCIGCIIKMVGCYVEIGLVLVVLES